MRWKTALASQDFTGRVEIALYAKWVFIALETLTDMLAQPTLSAPLDLFHLSNASVTEATMVSITPLAQCARRVIGAGLASGICALRTCGHPCRAVIKLTVFVSMGTLVPMGGPVLPAPLVNTRTPGVLPPATCVLLAQVLKLSLLPVFPRVPVVVMDSTTCMLDSPPVHFVTQALQPTFLLLPFVQLVYLVSGLLRVQLRVPTALQERIQLQWGLPVFLCA